MTPQSNKDTVDGTREISGPVRATVSREIALSGIKGLTVPASTLVVVRLVDSIVSTGSNVGKTFQATTSEPIVVMSQVVIPTGSSALVRMTVDKHSPVLGSK